MILQQLFVLAAAVISSINTVIGIHVGEKSPNPSLSVCLNTGKVFAARGDTEAIPPYAGTGEERQRQRVERGQHCD